MNGSRRETTEDQPSVFLVNSALRDRKKFGNVSESYAKQKLGRFYLATRLFVIVLQVLFNGRNFSTDAFKGVVLKPEEYTIIDGVIRYLFQGFTQWDAAHMLHIAENGYVLESSLAFFPLFPLTVKYSSYWAFPFTFFGLVHWSSIHLLTAVGLNVIFGYYSCMFLFDAVKSITRSVKQAHIATILFTVNPASVFFASAYSESMYTMFTMCGIASLIKRNENFWPGYFSSVGCFALAYLTRSNGLINFGYIGFYCLLNALFTGSGARPGSKVLLHTKGCNVLITQATLESAFETLLVQTVLFIAQLAIAIFFIAGPVSAYGYIQQQYFCDRGTLTTVSDELKSLAAAEQVDRAGQIEKLTWCSSPNIIFPSFYSAIQEKYWHVSLFGYWQIQKIPCFILAAPAFVIVVFGVLHLASDVQKNEILQYLADGGEMIPYSLHAAFLGLGALFFYNSEVLTRMLFSSTPFPYLVLSRWMSDLTPQVRHSDLLEPAHMPFFSYFALRGGREKAVFFYFMGYLVVGTTSHIMGLPFT